VARLLVHYDRPEALIGPIRERFPELEIAACDSYAALPEALQVFRPEVLLLIKFEGQRYPREAVLGCPFLEWVANGGVGVDHLAPWDPTRLTVTNAAGVASESMAFYVLGGIIAITQRLPHFMRLQRERRWNPDYIGSVAGRTVTVLGLGRTGEAVARLAAAAGLRVIGLRANPRPTPPVERVYGPAELTDALCEGDYVVVALPLVERTRGLVGASAFAAMKPGAVLIDVSRGGVVDSRALVVALASGRLGGAVLDVFDPEPIPPEHPVWALENVIITPHSSSVYEGWERRLAEMFCANLERYLDGAALENVVDPARGY